MKTIKRKGRQGKEEQWTRLREQDVKVLISRTMKGEDGLDVLEEMFGAGKFTRPQLSKKLTYLKKQPYYQAIYTELQAHIDKKIKDDLSWTIEKATRDLTVIIDASKQIIEEDLEIRFDTEYASEPEIDTETGKPTGKVISKKVWARDPDGVRVKKRRRLSQAATFALTDAVRELNKVHRLVEAANPADTMPVYFEGEARIMD